MLYQITRTRISSMPVALLTAYHHAVLTAINDGGGGAMGLENGLLSGYAAQIEAVQDYANRVTASAFTPELKRLDEARQTKFRILRNRLKVYADQMDDAESGSGQTLRVTLVNAYGNVLAASAQMRSGLIRGFIMDVSAVSAEVIAASGVSAALTALGKVNDDFEKLFVQKTAVIAQQGASQLVSLRQGVNETFRRLAIQLEASANATATTEEAQVAAALAQNTVAQLSRISREYRTLMKLSASQRRRATSGGSNEGDAVADGGTATSDDATTGTTEMDVAA